MPLSLVGLTNSSLARASAASIRTLVWNATVEQRQFVQGVPADNNGTTALRNIARKLAPQNVDAGELWA